MSATTTPRVPASLRRQQILKAATTLFAERGFYGTTTRQIADKVGVKEIILFRLFPNKRDLYWAVIEAKCAPRPEWNRLRELLGMDLEEDERFARIARGILERHLNDTTLTRLLLFSSLESHELTERFYRTYLAEFYDLLAGYIRRRIREKKFRRVDPLLAARGFIGMVFYHILVQELFGGARFTKFQIPKVADTITSVWLEGMLSR
jgi:AcrR family transcriptional regulator